MRRFSFAVSMAALTVAPAGALEGRTIVNAKAQGCRLQGEGMTCAAPGGWKIAVGYHTMAPTLAFIPPGKKLATPAAEPADGRDLSFVGIGPPDVAIWSGSAVTVWLSILPRAVHERMVAEGTPPASLKSSRVLAVFRVGAEGACPIAYADGADPKAAALAHEAVGDADKTKCPVKSIKLLGKPSAALASWFAD